MRVISFLHHGSMVCPCVHTYEIMRAMRLRGSGKTEAPFSCLPAPKVLMNMWLIILGSDMTAVVWQMVQMVNECKFSYSGKGVRMV